MADIVKRIASIFLEDDQPRESLKQLTAETRKLYNELAKLPRGSKEFIEKSKQYQEVSARLKRTREEVNGTNSTFEKLTKGLGPLPGLIGAAFGGAAVIGGIRKSREEFLAHEKAINAVTVALQNNGRQSGQTVAGLSDAADQLELSSLFSAEDILSGVSTKLLSFGNIANEEFNRAQQAAVDWASATGGDVAGAAQALGLALSNPEKGLTKLTRAGIVFSEEQKKVIQDLVDTGRTAEAQAIILGEFEAKFKGQAAASAENVKGVRALDQAFGDIVEGGGGFFNAMIEDIAGSLAPLVRGMGEWLGITSKQSEKLNEQRIEMNALFNVLRTGNHTQEEQAELVARINKEYGEFLPTQISVTDSTDALAAAQRAANTAMLERINLLARQELLEEAQQRAVDAQKEALEAEITFQRAQQDGLSTWEKAKAALMQTTNAQQYYANALLSSKANAAEAQAEYERMVASLGSVAAAQQAVQDSMAAGDGGAGLGPTPEELEQATQRGEEIRKALADARKSIEMDRLEGMAKEIRQTEDKYHQLALQSANSGVSIEEIETQQAEELAAIRAKYAKQEAERLKKLDDELRRLVDEQRVARVAAENRAEVEAINERYRAAREAVVGNNEAINELDRQQRAELFAANERNRAEEQAAADDQELQQVRAKYAKLQEEAKGNAARLLQVEALLHFELEAVRDRQAQQAQDRAEQRQAEQDRFEADVRALQLENSNNTFTLLQEQQAREWELAEQQGADLLALAQRQAEERAEFEQERKEAAIEALNAEFEERYAATDLSEQQLSELQRMHGEARAILDRQFASQSEQLQRDTDQRIIEGKRARRDAEIAVMNTIAGATKDLFVAAGADASEMATYEKLITLFQIGVDTASAISSLTAMSEANPANAVTGGAAGIAQFIAGFARITANVAQASALLSAAPPAPPAFALGGGTGAFIGGYAAPTSTNVSTGGTVRSKTLGWFGELGPEWVAPNWMYQHPTLEPVFAGLEDIRVSGRLPAYAEGGATGSTASAAPMASTATTTDSMAVLAALTGAVTGLTSQLQQGTLARVSQDQLEDTTDRLTTIRTESRVTR